MSLYGKEFGIIASQGYRPKKSGYIKAHRSAFKDHKEYGTVYTRRQEAIMHGEHVENLRKTEISRLINKAEYLGDYEIAENLYLMYGYMFHQREEGDPSYSEALAILDELTPDDLK